MLSKSKKKVTGTLNAYWFQCLGLMARYIKMTLNRRQRWCYLYDIENSNWKFYDLLLWLFFILKFFLKFVAYGLAMAEVSKSFLFFCHSEC